MNIIILGPQASGKGTQAKLLADKLNLFYFETGDFLRHLAKTDARINVLINEKGKLLPDNEMFGLAKGYLEKNVPQLDGMILDGYPRSLKQYELLKSWLAEKGRKIDHVVLLEVNEGESIKRLSARRICERCSRPYNLISNPPSSSNTCQCGGQLIKRVDDEPEAIRTRLDLYHQETEPLVEVFAKEKILVKIDGARPIQEIFNDILQKLDKEK